ncbi:MAG TPA: HDIG domain-containing protein [bacterium]|nr:HDIG domain-containing protein [bacterium]
MKTLSNLIGGEKGKVARFAGSKGAVWIAVVLLAFAVAFLSTMSFQQIPPNLREGAIAARNIKADRNYEIVDEEATDKFRRDAKAAVLSVYDLDEMVLTGVLSRVQEAFSAARTMLGNLEEPRGGRSGALPDDARREIESVFAEKLGVTPTPSMWKTLWSEGMSRKVETLLEDLLRKAMEGPVVAERASLDAEKEKGVVVRRVGGKEGSEQEDDVVIADVSSLASTEEARNSIKNAPVAAAGFRGPDAAASITALAKLLVEPNCAFNCAETERRRAEAADGVKSVIIKINAGEMIIREGSPFDARHLKTLRGIQKEKLRAMSSMEFLGTFMLVLLFMILPFTLVSRYFRRVSLAREDYYIMALVGLAVLVIMRISLMLAPAVRESLFVSASASSLAYAIPVAGGAMLLRMFLGAEVTVVFAVVMSILAGFFVEADAGFVAYCLVANFAAIAAIANVDRRAMIIRAGLMTGVAGAVAIVGIRLVAMTSATESVAMADILWSAFFAFLGGIGAAIFTMIAAPIVESTSSFTSDIKLLELANLNHPLLRELIVRAPGTYHHSHMAGILGEAAAEAIGAKALLVRVGAYYHDIGKIKKPLYFIENVKSGENRHERLSPHMSALIIAAHVKDGIEMAERAGVPKLIVDMIPQHHGTRLISFFYEKAKEMEDKEVNKADQKDFMYPGPKPQTREAAILMLADATEAAVRAIKEKSTTRVQQTVQRVITDIFMEKQLDECDLTLKDLNEIARAFMRTLLGIYHSRIEYPKDAENEKDKAEVSIVDESSTSVDLSGEPTPIPKTEG